MADNTQSRVSWTTPAGQLDLLPSQGRVLQAQVGGENAFWLPETYQGDWNVGGDRLWLAPETDWFIQYEDGQPAGYEVPKALDPGTWTQRVFTENVCEWEQQSRLKNQRLGSFLELRLRRRISLLPDDSRFLFTHSLAYATDDAATILTGIPQQQIGFWSLIQVPGGGKAYVGTRRMTDPRDCFHEVADLRYEVGEGYTALELTGRKRFKAAISPEQATGTLLYVRPAANGAYVGIVRRFFSQPWRNYCDAPLNEGEQGDAVQLYSDDGSLGVFGEIEYHSAAFAASDSDSQFGASHLTIVGTIAADDLESWLAHWLNDDEAWSLRRLWPQAW